MKMKKLSRLTNILHVGIIVLCLYSVFCCGFHVLPVWGYSENYVSINTTLLSIALSYIAGYVIYLFTSVIPRKQREEEVFSLWEKHLSSLYNEMAMRIEEVREFAGIPEEKMANLVSKDANLLAKYTDYQPLIIIEKKSILEDPNNPQKVIDEFDIKNHLNSHYDTMHHLIGIMLNNPMAIDSNKKVLDLLTRIKESRFLKECESIIGEPIENRGIRVSITNAELPKAYVDYVNLKNELAELPIKKYTFKVRKLTEEEVQEVKNNTERYYETIGLTPEQDREIKQQIVEASKKSRDE